MKRFCLVVVGGLLLWQVTAVASAHKCKAPYVINIQVNPDGFEYPDKATSPVPMIERGCPFKVVTTWNGTGSDQSITLSDFRAVHAKPGKPDKWDQVEARTLQDATGTPVTGNKWTFTEDNPNGTFILGGNITGPPGPPRLILFTVTLVIEEGDAEVTFDPPWSEKRP